VARVKKIKMVNADWPLAVLVQWFVRSLHFAEQGWPDASKVVESDYSKGQPSPGK